MVEENERERLVKEEETNRKLEILVTMNREKALKRMKNGKSKWSS